MWTIVDYYELRNMPVLHNVLNPFERLVEVQEWASVYAWNYASKTNTGIHNLEHELLCSKNIVATKVNVIS